MFHKYQVVMSMIIRIKISNANSKFEFSDELF